MFLERENLTLAECHSGAFSDAESPSLPALPIPASAEVYSGGRYGDRRRPRTSSIALAVGVHLMIVPFLLGLGYQAVTKKEDRFVAVDLSPPPAPPPPSRPKAPPRQQKLETTIQPLVQIPAPVVQPIALPLTETPALAQPAILSAPPAPPTPPAPPATPSTVTSNALGTRMIAGTPPRYPVESRRKKEQGTVQLLLVLGIDGAVETISVARSSGFSRLDEAALHAVRRWRWAATMRDGSAVKVKGVVEIPFVLNQA